MSNISFIRSPIERLFAVAVHHPRRFHAEDFRYIVRVSEPDVTPAQVQELCFQFTNELYKSPPPSYLTWVDEVSPEYADSLFSSWLKHCIHIKKQPTPVVIKAEDWELD